MNETILSDRLMRTTNLCLCGCGSRFVDYWIRDHANARWLQDCTELIWTPDQRAVCRGRDEAFEITTTLMN
jgi:hypothetical protein